MKPQSLIAMFMAFANELRFKQLFLLILALFLLDLVIPDFIPMIDEIILGLLALLLANLKKSDTADQKKVKGNVIEGEVIEDNENN